MEFALSLPLLVVFVVGIFDFTGALALKQKLTNAARDAARVAAADPDSDLANTAGTPVSVSDALQVVDNYLLAEKISDCGLAGPPLMAPVPSGSLIWTASAVTGCPGAGLVVTINRGTNPSPGGTVGCVTQQTLGANQAYVVNTCVTIQYAYKWRYGSLSGLVGGGAFPGVSNITTTATAFNEN